MFSFKSFDCNNHYILIFLDDADGNDQRDIFGKKPTVEEDDKDNSKDKKKKKKKAKEEKVSFFKKIVHLISKLL